MLLSGALNKDGVYVYYFAMMPRQIAASTSIEVLRHILFFRDSLVSK